MKDYKIVNLEQRSEEWKKWRLEGIGASDMPAILGKSPYTSKRELFEIKKVERGENKLDDFIMIKADCAEQDFKAKIHEMLKIDFTPVCVESLENPRFKASLDGLNEKEGKILEVKYAGEDYVNLLKKNKSLSVREDHLVQIQFQLLVTGLKECYYGVCAPSGNSALIKVVRDEFLIEIIKKEAEKFLSDLDNDIKPEYTSQDTIELTLENELEVCEAIKKISVLTEAKNNIEKRIEELKKRLDCLEYKNYILLDNEKQYQIMKVEREGSISYAKLVKDKLKDMPIEEIEKYRGKPSSYWKFTTQDLKKEAQ
jgi:putative phage-type endonuclease